MNNNSEERSTLKILYLEDSPKDAEIVRELLAGPAPDVTIDIAATKREFKSFLAGCGYDVILTDFRVSGFDGFESLRLAAAVCPGVPVICISGAIGEETAVEMLKAGAVDYVLKDRLARLPSAIERAISEAKGKAARRQVTEDLRKAKQEMENFLYITSHDLNSPLINIQGFSQNLVKDFNELMKVLAQAALTQDARGAVDDLAGGSIPEALGYITESVEKMDQLIRAVLKVSRLGRVEMRPKALDANAVLKGVLAGMRFQLEEADAAVKAEDLPPCKADTGAVSQILNNLLSNAIAYRDKNRKLEITVRGERNSPATALYMISDNGVGIKAGDLPDIWQIFSSGKKTAGKKVEGIGLAICRMLAEKNGGRIWAESKEGEGSTFFVEMPV